MRRLEQPLSVGEVLAETTRLYGDRIRAVLAIGVFMMAAYVLATKIHPLAGIVVLLLAQTAALAVTTRMVAGDALDEAAAQAVLRAPVLLVLAFVVFLPFVVIAQFLLLLLFAAAWLALAAFAIPVAMLEPHEGSRVTRLSRPLQRTIQLARVEYVHAVGVVAVMVMAYLLFGRLLEGVLMGFAGVSALSARALVQLVLAPFFFLGLAVLYFDQNARALSSPGKSRRGGRADADVHHHVEPERAGAADASGEPRAAPRGEP
ncbi:MAG: hypothetical protein KY396_05890 [Actinobacteria bacterium]|nr:hypothetical protein [Actinomycetota bacterium]